MKPLLLVFWGMAVVVADLRINGFDLLPDVVGWLMVVAALSRLSHRDGSFTIAAWAAGLGAVLSLVQLIPEWTSGELLPHLVGIGENVAMTVMNVAVCTGVARLATGEPTIARRARRVRAAALVLVAVAVPLVVTVQSGYLPAVVMILAGVATFAVCAWFFVLLWSAKDHPELQGRPVRAEVV